jgi:hypothetical protein
MRCQTVTRRRRPDTTAKKGLTFDPGPTSLWTGIRLQTRFDDYPGQNPSAADLRLERDSELDLNRGRLKGGGCSAN